MKPLNEKQQKVLEFLRERAGDGVPPSVREICAAAGIRSTSTVHAYLKVLEEGGYISRQSGLNRAIRLPGETVARVPLLGHVTAGLPILATENIEDYLVLPQSLQGRGDLFALRVQGESMIEAGIEDGDIVVLRRQETAENGEIVVAMIDDEATLKRVYYEDGHVRLQPENAAMEPIYADEVVILGRLLALFRQY